MTEEEAKTKWCPFARTKTLKFSSEDGGVAAANRDFDGLPIDQLHSCMASACMAWRAFNLDAQMREGGPRGGFCGLAGAPS